MATTTWFGYLILNFVLIPVWFLLRYQKTPFVVPIVPRCRYDLVEHGYGWLVMWFSTALLTGASSVSGVRLGICLVLVGSAMIAAAVGTLGRNWRIGQDTSDTKCVYVAKGIYRFVSHPIYVGMILVAIGQALLMSGDWRAMVLLSGTSIYVVIQGREELRRWRGLRPNAWTRLAAKANAPCKNSRFGS